MPERYTHFKGGGYELVTRAKREADETPVVVYRSVETGDVWVRPEAGFFEEIERDGISVQRFTKIN